jgi:hypothetical protein
VSITARPTAQSGGHYADGRYVLSEAEREGIRRDVRALPALSDEALDGLAAVILDAREQRAAGGAV